MQPLRFGIVGCGGIANIHAEAMKRLEEEGVAKLLAGAEPHPERRQQFGQKWGIAMHESLESLLQRKDLDAVCVCSLGGMHAQQSIQIARSGRHVLCEKPLDTRLERAAAAIAAARENHVVLGGIFQQRFAANAMKVKRAIDGGYFGKIVLVHCETPWYRAQPYYDQASWRGTWDMDGGVLSNQAPHMLDRMLWLGGDVEEVLSATCAPGLMRKIEAETLAVATLRLKNGALGTITATTLAFEGMPPRVMICGTEGSAALCDDELTYFKTSRPFEDAPPSANVGKGTLGDARASQPLALSIEFHLANIRDFAQAVREGRPPLVSAEESLKVVRLINMIYEKARVGPYAGTR
jgi:UDP-N-acetyl-2-amino-2-deoxyglucuronate dehydrogenase